MRDERSWLKTLSGRFLVFEGPDGSGKSTQLRRFVRTCQDAGLSVCEVREPGGTAIGEQIRQVLLHTKAEMTLRCEMLLYMASRAQLVEQEIRPALASGKIVLADRYLASTLAYQGTAGGIATDDILAVAKAALCGVMPDLTLIFDVDEHTAAARINPLLSSTARAGALDRIESRGSEFHRKVREGYLAQVRANPETYRRIDASQSEPQVWEQVMAVLRQKFSTA